MTSSKLLDSRRPTAAVVALAMAICAVKGAAPSRRSMRRTCPPSSQTQMLTAQFLARAWVAAASTMRRQSSWTRKLFVFIATIHGQENDRGLPDSLAGSGSPHAQYLGTEVQCLVAATAATTATAVAAAVATAT